MALDLGCGKRSPLGCYRNQIELLTGTDLDFQDLRDNADINLVSLANGVSLPFSAGVFDLILSKTVIEHVYNPQALFREAFVSFGPVASSSWRHRTGIFADIDLPANAPDNT